MSRVQVTFVGALGAGKSNLCRNLVKPGFDDKSDSTPGIHFNSTCTMLSTSVPFDENVGPLLNEVEEGQVTCSAIATVVKEKSAAISNQDGSTTVTKLGIDTTSSTQLKPKDDLKRFEKSAAPKTSFTAEELQKLRKRVQEALKDEGDRIFIDLLDCGGQLSFSVCQTISFSADQSIFVLAYDSSIPMDAEVRSEFRQDGEPLHMPAPRMTNKDYLRLWLSTLAMLEMPKDRRPTVVVVGTRSEKKSSDWESVRAVFDDFKEKLVILGHHFVDNSDPLSSDMIAFRKFMLKCIQDQAALTCEKVELSFLMCEWCVRHERNTVHQTKTDFERFAYGAAGVEEDKVDRLLRYLHNNCAVRYFNNPTDQKQAELTVYFNIPWLLDQVCELLSCTMKKADGWPADIASDIKLLKTKGILKPRLVEYLWSDKKGFNEKVRKDLLRILGKLGLLCEIPTEALDGMPQKAGTSSFVPICIQYEQIQLPDRFRDWEAMPYLVLQAGTDFFPYGEFSRLLVRVLQHCDQSMTKVKTSLCYLRFQMTGEAQNYVAEVKHFRRGIAVGLMCATSEMATGRQGKENGMAFRASALREIVRNGLETTLTESCSRRLLTASFFCPTHSGESKLNITAPLK